jgi:hypothetical protein
MSVEIRVSDAQGTVRRQLRDLELCAGLLTALRRDLPQAAAYPRRPRSDLFHADQPTTSPLRPLIKPGQPREDFRRLPTDNDLSPRPDQHAGSVGLSDRPE